VVNALGISKQATDIGLDAGCVYIVLVESDLAILIKKINSSTNRLGEDIGVISFNETVLKELLEITVITTDFEVMGRTAAELILSHTCRSIRNPFKLILRKSL
jgi:DNA-binding LacI/PurR family transcriptional regulator